MNVDKYTNIDFTKNGNTYGDKMNTLLYVQLELEFLF